MVRNVLRAATAAAGAITLVVISPIAAQASTHHTFADHFSSDGHAQLVGGPSYMEWDPKSYTANYELADISADGRGPIVQIRDYAQNPVQAVNPLHHWHNTDGSGTTRDYPDGAADRGFYLNKVTVRVCNGGTKDAPQNCGAWFNVDNPTTG